MSDLDRAFDALSNTRRRRMLLCLKEHRDVSLADLAELVAEDEYDRNIVGIDGTEVTEIYMTLYHNHLPVLEAAGLIEYDQEEDFVRFREEATPILERAHDRLGLLLQID